MSVVDQLVEMGFDRAKAEKAHSATGDAGVEQAMEWLISHDAEIDSEAVAEAGSKGVTTEDTAILTEQTPGSYKCNDCGKLFRDENGMMFHASKSGHENFSESTEELKPLTEEERIQKAADLRNRIRAARAVKEENERKENLEKEKRRREEGKKMLEVRQQQKDNELRAIAEERRREKQEALEAKNRVLEQIKRDKEDRLARAAGRSGVAVPTPTPTTAAPPTPKTDYTQANIQIRLPTGQAVKHTFGAGEPLSAVRLWLEMNHMPVSTFSLFVPFPRKVFTAEDYDTPLKELGLVPSASLVMTQ